MSGTNKQLVRRFLIEVCSQGNLPMADELVAADYVSHNPGPGEAPGREGLKAYIAYLHRAFADICIKIEEQEADGETVVTSFKVSCTHQGEFAGIPPSGKLAGITATTIHHIEDGQIQECWLSWTEVE